jgi:hypothetical protein
VIGFALGWVVRLTGEDQEHLFDLPFLDAPIGDSDFRRWLVDDSSRIIVAIRAKRQRAARCAKLGAMQLKPPLDKTAVIRNYELA